MKSVEIPDLDYVINREEKVGRFFLPYEEIYAQEPRRFFAATFVVEFCVVWLWYRWLKGGAVADAYKVSEAVIANSIRLQADEGDIEWRAEHDLFSAHLVAVAGRREQIVGLAEQMVFAKDASARDLCQQAWSGFMRFSLLGDLEMARSQAEIMFGATKPLNLRLPRKPLVRAWLDEDWRAFNLALKQSFSRLWASLRQDGCVLSEIEGQAQISLKRRNLRVGIHWQENALAMLASEKGVSIATDPLWLPEIALRTGIDRGPCS